MRSIFIPILAALLSLTSAAPAPQPVAATPAHNTTSITIDTTFITNLEAMFRGTYPPTLKPSSPNSISIQGDLLAPSDPSNPAYTINDLNLNRCGPALLIYARGTTQDGNIGAKPGVKLAAAFKAAIPGAIVQGVLPYPADVFGYLAGGSSEGADTMVKMVTRAVTLCPGIRIVLSGYSQGAQVVHKAALKIPTALHPYIAALVTIGDPNRDDKMVKTLEARRLTVCNVGDLICDGLPLPFGSHAGEAYELRIPEMVRFVLGKV